MSILLVNRVCLNRAFAPLTNFLKTSLLCAEGLNLRLFVLNHAKTQSKYFLYNRKTKIMPVFSKCHILKQTLHVWIIDWSILMFGKY